MVEIVRNKAVNYALTGKQSRAQTYQQRMLKLFGASTIIGLWTQGEVSGTVCRDASGNGRNGTYTGVQLAQPGIDRFTAAKYDGLTSYADVFSASVASAFVANTGTASVFALMSSGGLLDGTTRRLIHLKADNNNRLTLVKVGAVMQGNYLSAGNVNGVTKTLTSENWVHVALTWSKPANAVTLYVNGVPAGTSAIVGSWSGTLTVATVGAGDTTPANVWSGSLQYAMLLNRVATASEIAQMARAV